MDMPELVDVVEVEPLDAIAYVLFLKMGSGAF